MANAKQKQKQKSQQSQQPRETSPPRPGMPGDGAGRVEDPGTEGQGVFPASGPPTGNPDAQYQPMASFGQGERGAAGYHDSGQSEVFTIPPGDPPDADGTDGGADGDKAGKATR